MVSQVFYINSDKFPTIANDYSEAQTRAEKITHQPKKTADNSLFPCAVEAVHTLVTVTLYVVVVPGLTVIDVVVAALLHK